MASAWSLPFFTEVDPEIAVKGSIDPLGMLPLWSRYGREVVGNLTLVGSSARGFTTVLLGYHFARRAVEERGVSDEQFVDAFLIVEQLAAYSRFALAESTGDRVGRILGVRRVSARYAERSGSVVVGPRRDAQIMSNQKAYGLWGLFNVAAEDSGLLDRRRLRLTAEGQAIVDKTILPVFDRHALKDGSALLRFILRPGTFEPTGRHAQLGRALAGVHRPRFRASEQPFYLEHLVHGHRTFRDGRQRAFWELLREVNDEGHSWDAAFGMGELRRCIAAAEARARNGSPVHATLADRLEKIRRFEQIAAPAARLFEAMQDWDGRSLDAIADDVRSQWGTALDHIDDGELEDILAPVAALHGDTGVARIEALRRALRRGEYREAVRYVIVQNAEVMRRRRGGPWITIDDDTLTVRYRQEPRALPSRKKLPDLWVHPYFLGSLKQVGAEVCNLSAGAGATELEERP